MVEDHSLLKGQISIVGIENVRYAERFASLFNCDWDKIDCALMAIGNYGQQEQNGWRFQFASKYRPASWYGLFHKSANEGFENTKNILIQLLSKSNSFNSSYLASIAVDFMSKCEANNAFPWRYYYVKYSVFRPGSYGKLSNGDYIRKPYLFSVMQTQLQWSSNTYMPYLKEADKADETDGDDKTNKQHLSRESMGQRLVYGTQYIYCENDAYVRCGLNTNGNFVVIERIIIPQNSDGVDTADRIVILKEYLKNNMTD